MPRDSSYFEEALALFVDPDPNVRLIAESTYQTMLNEYSEGNVPRTDANILYIFQASILLWLSKHPDLELSDTHFPYQCASIKGSNWPDSVGSERQIIVTEFVDMVRRDSVPTGSDFDVSYAARVIAITLTDEGELLNPVTPDALDDFDQWLSGFNKLQ